MSILRRITNLFHRSKLDQEIEAELRSHIEMRTADNMAAGMSPEGARRDALLRFGNRAVLKERVTAANAQMFLDSVWQDLCYGLRMLRKSPGFTAVAILTLALGIGANTAIFTVVDKVLLEPLPYPQPDQLVQLEDIGPYGISKQISIPEFNALRQQTQAFQAVAVFRRGGPGLNMTGVETPKQVRAIRASADFFPVFGVSMEIGRAYTRDEDRPNGPKLAVLTNGFWRSQFGADRHTLGKTIQLGGIPYTIIGVTAGTFHPEFPVDIIIPLNPNPNADDTAHFFFSVARMKPRITVGMAKAAMQVAAAEFRNRFPGAMGPQENFTAVPLQDAEVGDTRLSLLVLLGAVGFVLLIACTNVANLLLVRATIRRREIAIRAALGAGRRRIISQLLTESVLLSFIGGILGLFLGYFGARALLAINPGDIPLIGEHGRAVHMDWPVLGFTLLISILVGISFGLIPALSASRADLSMALRESGAQSGGALRQNKIRSLLVVTEMALALTLLVGAGLLIRSFVSLRSVDPGFDPHNVLTMDMAMNGPQFQNTASVWQLVREATQRIDAVPGVEGMATTCCLPLESSLALPFNKDGGAHTASQYSGGADYNIVSPEYFSVLRIPLLRGRLFTIRDNAGAPGVVVISENMAKRFWQRADALGAQITIGRGVGREFADVPRTVIGIVGDVHQEGLDSTPDPIMYVPLAQVPDGITALNAKINPLQFAVRTNVDPTSLSAEFQRVLREASGGLPVGRVGLMDQIEEESTAQTNFNMTLLTIFAAVALLLATIGLYGVLSYVVTQQTHEIGIRMALGAQRHDVMRLMLVQGACLALVGIAIGLLAAFGLTRLMASLLYGISASDPLTFALVTVVLLLVALAACYIPVRRAMKVDPMVALRYE